MAMEEIRIGGARQHNLKNVSLTLPRNKLVVLTGVSGSGKSSLAFDTLYAEGQRRYVESLSTYARQYLEQMEKPDVDFIEGLSPAIAIEQRTAGGNPRSTIATTTEIHDFLRLLFAHLGQPHHPKTGKPLRRWSVQQMVDRVLAAKEGTPVQILAPVIQKQKGEFRDVVEKLRREGFVRARFDGKIAELEQPPRLDKARAHTIEAVIDRLKISDAIKTRLTDSLELALKTGNGVVTILFGPPDAVTEEIDAEQPELRSRDRLSLCRNHAAPFLLQQPAGRVPGLRRPRHRIGLRSRAAHPRWLRARWRTCRSRRGAAPRPRWRSSIKGQIDRAGHGLQRADVAPLSRMRRRLPARADRRHRRRKNRFTTTRQGKTVITERPFEGLIAQLTRLHAESKSELTRHRLHQYMTRITCRTCDGARLRPEVLAVTLGGPP